MLNQRWHVFVGVILITAAFGLGAIQNALVKSVGPHASIFVIVFFQYIVCLILLIPSLLRNKPCRPQKQHWPLLLGRAFAGLAYFGLMFVALRYTTLVNVAILSNTAPLWVPLLVWIFMDKPISKATYLGLIIGFIGVVLILMPGMRSSLALHLGDLIAIASAIAMATAIILLNRLSKTESHQLILLVYFCFCSICMLPFAILTWHQLSPITWLFILLNGLLMFCHQMLLNKGMRLGEAPELSVSAYMTVPFSAILGYYFWHEAIQAVSLIGIILVIIGGAYIIFISPTTKCHIRLKENAHAKKNPFI